MSLSDSDSERRRHPRLAMCLALAYEDPDQPASNGQDVTINVGAGGVYFGTGPRRLSPGRRVRLDLCVPPGAGHWPYSGRIRGLATVVRCARRGKGWAAAARFDEALRLEF